MKLSVPDQDALGVVVDCIAEVLGLAPEEVGPGTPLAVLGLESFTAVRLRRRIRERTGRDLPLTAFLGAEATAVTLAGGGRAEETGAAEETLRGKADETVRVEDGAAAEVAGAGEDETFALTAIQASYLAGRAEGMPLGGVATYYYYEYDRSAPGGDQVADLARLEAAWNRLVEHHPMLRMAVDERGRQRIAAAPGPYRIGSVDLRNAPEQQVRETLDALRNERSHPRRPTGSWPLFDLYAALLPGGRTRLSVGVDVLMTDLAGWMLLMRQWGRLVAEPTDRLPDPEIRFAELQQSRAGDPEWAAQRERDRAYWAERGAELPPSPRLPVRRDPADITPPRFVRAAASLDPAPWTEFRARCTEHGVTPTAALLAAFAVVLGRWGAGEQVCLNTTLFDRPDDGAENVVGDFTTTALIGTPPFRPADWKGFAEYAAAVNYRFWEDLDHRSVSGVEVLRDLRTGPSVQAPDHPVVFTSGVGLDGESTPPAAWLGDEVYGISQTPQVLFDHIVWDEGGRLRLAWDTVEGAFPDGWIAALLDAYVRLLHTLTRADAWRDTALGWDPSFRPEEPLDVRPFPSAGPLLHDPLVDAVRRDPDRPALHGSGTTVTHARLADNAAATAALLTAYGVGPGELVAVACEKGIAQLTAVLGVSLSGAGYLPVEPTWPDARIAAVCERAGVRHALTGRGVGTNWPDGVTVHRLTAAGRPGRSATIADGDEAGVRTPVTPRPDDLAYTIFTSGSTGSPKGVEIEHRAARVTIDDVVDRFGVGPEDRVLALSALSFDLSVFDLYGVLGAGGSLVLPEPARQRDPQHWLELAGRHGVTIWNTAPALLEMLVEYAEMEPGEATAALSSLRLVMLSGDWIPLTLPERLHRLAPQARFMSLGGATEASIWSITYPVERTDPAWRSIPYGRALRGQSFHVLDDEGGPCPVGEAGELFIGGDGLARGYAADPAQTAERFAVHPVLGRRLYRTGDLGRWTAEGTIEFLGRADRQVKIRGHRIELGEVEAVLARHPAVRQCVVSSLRGRDGRPRLVAHLSTRGTSVAPAPDALAASLREWLPDYMVPSRFVVLDQLPVTANGKIDHAALTASPTAQTDGLQVATEVPARGAVPVGAGTAGDGSWLVSAAAEAAALGLEAVLLVRPGRLPAEQALEASAGWLRKVGRTTAGEARLSPNGLAEVVLSPASDSAPASNESDPIQSVVQGNELGAPAVGGIGSADRPDGTALLPDAVIDPGVLDTLTAVLAEFVDGPVTPESTFQALGATSLTLVLTHRRLREGIAPRLALAEMFEHATVAALAARITVQQQTATPGPPAAPSPTGSTATGPTPAGPPFADGPAGPERPQRRTSRRAARALAEETAR